MTGIVNGIYYELIEGKKKDKNLVFVHGSGCNRKFLKPLAEEIPEYNCYLIDLPDHGKSAKKNCTSAEEYIEGLANFVSTLENVVLIGHSLGGTICLGVCEKKIPSVISSVIISSGASFPKLDRKFMNKIYKNKVDMLYLRKCCGSYFSLLAWKQLLNLENNKIVIQDLIIDDKVNVEAGLENIDIPVLILVGGDEILTLVEYSELLNEKIKNSKLVVIPKFRHMLPIADKENVAKLIKNFI